MLQFIGDIISPHVVSSKNYNSFAFSFISDVCEILSVV